MIFDFGVQEDSSVTFAFGWDETKQKVQNSNVFLEPMEEVDQQHGIYVACLFC